MREVKPVTPVTEINSIKGRLNVLERNKNEFLETSKNNVNINFVGDSQLVAGTEFELRSSSVRPIFETVFTRLHLDFEQLTPVYFNFDIMIDDTQVQRIHVPEGVEHTKHNIAPFVITPTRTLTLFSSSFPSGMGIIDVTIVGISQNVINQTGQLSFGEI